MEKTSKFNSAFAFINRLNVFLSLIADARYRKDASEWLDMGIQLYAEIADDLDEEQTKEIESEIEKLHRSVAGFQDQLNNGQNISLPWNLYIALHKFELKVKKLIKEAGYKTKYTESAEEEMYN